VVGKMASNSKKEKIIYPEGLQEYIDDFYSGKLDIPKRKESKKSLNCVNEVNYNCKNFPDKSVSSLTTSGDTLSAIQERIF